MISKAAGMPAARSEGLVVSDGVADRRADTEDVVGAEASAINIIVVVDVVVVHLGTDENMMPDVVA